MELVSQQDQLQEVSGASVGQL